jgi:hypothetical protein
MKTKEQIVLEVKEFIYNKFDLLQSLEDKPNSGGQIRHHSGILVEDLVSFIWNVVVKNYPNKTLRIIHGKDEPIKLVNKKGDVVGKLNESVDRHCFINDKLVAIIECKTYLDKSFMQRADSDFALIKTGLETKPTSMIVSLENAVADSAFNYIMNVGNIDNVFFFSKVKRNSAKNKRIYKHKDRILDVLILNLITKVEEIINGAD